jgi:hypothetical protein
MATIDLSTITRVIVPQASDSLFQVKKITVNGTTVWEKSGDVDDIVAYIDYEQLQIISTSTHANWIAQQGAIITPEGTTWAEYVKSADNSFQLIDTSTGGVYADDGSGYILQKLYVLDSDGEINYIEDDEGNKVAETTSSDWYVVDPDKSETKTDSSGNEYTVLGRVTGAEVIREGVHYQVYLRARSESTNNEVSETPLLSTSYVKATGDGIAYVFTATQDGIYQFTAESENAVLAYELDNETTWPDDVHTITVELTAGQQVKIICMTADWNDDRYLVEIRKIVEANEDEH